MKKSVLFTLLFLFISTFTFSEINLYTFWSPSFGDLNNQLVDLRWWGNFGIGLDYEKNSEKISYSIGTSLEIYSYQISDMTLNLGIGKKKQISDKFHLDNRVIVSYMLWPDNWNPKAYVIGLEPRFQLEHNFLSLPSLGLGTKIICENGDFKFFIPIYLSYNIKSKSDKKYFNHCN